MPTIAEFIQANADSEATAVAFEGRSWTWKEYVTACNERAALALQLRTDEPFHIGLLFENTPEFAFWLGAAALAGATAVGINPTRRGAELARDITHTDCQMVITEASGRPLLDGLDLGLSADRIVDTDAGDYGDLLAPHQGAGAPDVEVAESDRYLLLFTSGTSGAPKAVITSQGRLANAGLHLADGFGLGVDDAFYLAMPMFHSNALFAGFAPALRAGGKMVLRRKFSASGFLPDVREHGVTYFNYVGKPLAYILATEEQAKDGDNPLTWVFGNEAADTDITRFGERFGCVVVDNYGSTEGGATVLRSPGQPDGALGKADEHLAILDPETGGPCATAEFDAEGRLTNPEEAIGEMVNTGESSFEGYWNNDEANQARTRDGQFWTGDLAYKDADGWVYFAGRGYDWLRVDGENFSAAPVERVLSRHPDIAVAAVYAVPDEDVGDQLMVAMILRDDADFDPAGFTAFLDEQPDLGTKWVPRYVRVAPALPSTQTNKVLKRQLRAERWETDDTVWWRPGRGEGYRMMTDDDQVELRARFSERGRLDALDTV
jgi:fatty-acyl-CoA synthase